MKVYPICLLNLHEKKCVVIGGGAVAERRVEGLLFAHAQVTVISPMLTPKLHGLAVAGKLTYVARAYCPGDLEGAFLALAATDDRTVNEQVWREGDANGVLVNVVDDVAHSHFITPAVLNRGDLSIAVSTGGHSPALTARIKDELAVLYGPEYADLVQILGDLRPRLLAELSPEQRRAFTHAVLESDVGLMLRDGDRVSALARLEEILEKVKGKS